MPSSSIDRDLLPLSWLSQWGYCPRRCGLLAVEQLWADNEYTAEGTLQHRRAHTARTERRGNFIAMYEAPVVSMSLGLSGFCDCVEARRMPNDPEKASVGAVLPECEGQWQLFPVEYKHGVVRPNETEYHLQLCAQAICLEEMYGGHIPTGAVFFIQSHRRDEVELTEELRRRTSEAALAICEMVASGVIPRAPKTAKCRKCSMLDACMPDVQPSAAGYLNGLKESLAKDMP